jgi:hypothetical protein
MVVRITLVIVADEDGPELVECLNELCAEVISDRLNGDDYPPWLTATYEKDEEE